MDLFRMVSSTDLIDGDSDLGNRLVVVMRDRLCTLNIYIYRDLFIYLFIYLLIYLFIYLFIYLCI